ncbi:MAG: hypothetical protein ACRD96_12140 [Bryobacteraceae bacterium]
MADRIFGSSRPFHQKIPAAEETQDPSDDIHFTPVRVQTLPATGMTDAITPVSWPAVSPTIIALWGALLDNPGWPSGSKGQS